MGLGLDGSGRPKRGGMTLKRDATMKLVPFDKPVDPMPRRRPADDLASSLSSRRMGDSMAGRAAAAVALSETAASEALAATAALGGGGDSDAAATAEVVTVPDHVRLTGQMLFFKGYFSEAVTESATETFRRRAIIVRYFMEDDTFEVFEGRIKNDGMSGVKFLNRQQHDAVTLDTLRVRGTLTLYSRTFKITACDAFTRNYYRERGTPQPADEDIPDDTFTATYRKALAATSGWSGKRTNAISRYVEAVRGKAVRKKDTLGKFLKHSGEVLRFYALYDESKVKADLFAVKQHMCIQYFLADDTAEILRVRLPGEAKTMEQSRILRRGRLPKVYIVHDDRERSAEDGTGDEDYYSPEDFRVGETMRVLGKNLDIYDCDDFTHDFYADKFGWDQKAHAIDLTEPPKPVPKLPVPPHNGFGSEEDTLHSVKYLDPQSHAHKSDYKRFLRSKGQVLKFYAKLKSEDPIDKLRRYRISWYLDDDTVAVYEDFVRNTGIMGGKWQARKKMKNPETGKPFEASDLFVGAEVTIKGHRFVLDGADDFSHKYMEGSASLWPMSSLEFVLSKLKDKLREKSASLRKMFRKFDTDHSQTISLDEFQSMLDYFGMTLSKAECVTIFRAFDKDGEGFIDYTEFMEAFTDKDEDGGAAAATSSAHADAAAAASMTEDEAKAYAEMVAEREAAAKLTAETDTLLTRLARGMKQAKSASKIHENFRRFDINKDHTIDRGEFRAAMGSSGFHLSEREIGLLEVRFFPSEDAADMNYETFMGVLHEYADKIMVRS